MLHDQPGVLDNYDMIIEDYQKQQICYRVSQLAKADWGRPHKAAAWALRTQQYTQLSLMQNIRLYLR